MFCVLIGAVKYFEEFVIAFLLCLGVHVIDDTFSVYMHLIHSYFLKLYSLIQFDRKQAIVLNLPIYLQLTNSFISPITC